MNQTGLTKGKVSIAAEHSPTDLISVVIRKKKNKENAAQVLRPERQFDLVNRENGTLR